MLLVFVGFGFCWLLLENLTLINKIKTWGSFLFIYWSKFCFLGLVYVVLVSVVLKVFLLGQPWWRTFFTHFTHYKKASYGPNSLGYCVKLFSRFYPDTSSFKHDTEICICQVETLNQSGTCLNFQKRYYCVINVFILIWLNNLIILWGLITQKW